MRPETFCEKLMRIRFRRLINKLQLCIFYISVETDPCCWNRWVRSITNVECLLGEGGFRVMMDRIFSTHHTIVQCNAIAMLMSSGGVTQHIRDLVWAYCTDLLNDLDVERYFCFIHLLYSNYCLKFLCLTDFSEMRFCNMYLRLNINDINCSLK